MFLSKTTAINYLWILVKILKKFERKPQVPKTTATCGFWTLGHCPPPSRNPGYVPDSSDVKKYPDRPYNNAEMVKSHVSKSRTVRFNLANMNVAKGRK
jgi:hypothetical protein